MAMVFGILEEEKRRLIALKEQYENSLKNLPKGSLSRKKRWNKEYVYLAYRESGKVKFDYIGPAESEAVQKMAVRVQKRRELEEKIDRVVQNLAEVERGLRGKR